MQDMIIKGTGNSRYLKSVPNIMTLYPTYESFAAALQAGTFPVDFNGINPTGVEQAGTALNKANLLSDALCTALSIPTTSAPTQAMEKLHTMAAAGQSRAKITSGSYVGDGSNTKTLTLPFAPLLFIVAGRETYNYSNKNYRSTEYGAFLPLLGYGLGLDFDSSNSYIGNYEVSITTSGTTVTFNSFNYNLPDRNRAPYQYVALG